MHFKEIPKPKRYAPNLYSYDVLNGNWFERRLEGHLDKKAITPSITGKSDCVAHKSTYQEDFIQHILPEDLEDAIEARNDLRVQAYRNRVHGYCGNINLNDGDKFLNNLTTTTDISYRIIPKSIKTTADSKHGESSTKYDVFKVYGNATKTGLLAWQACEKRKTVRLDMTVTKTDFVPLPVKPIVIAKGRK